VAKFGKKEQFYMERTHWCEAGVIVIPKSGIKYNRFIIVIRGEPINLVWPPKGFNKFKYDIRYTPVVMITNYTKIISSIVL
jgi:hypothetical protein